MKLSKEVLKEAIVNIGADENFAAALLYLNISLIANL
jgi:hypothetical protein